MAAVAYALLCRVEGCNATLDDVIEGEITGEIHQIFVVACALLDGVKGEVGHVLSEAGPKDRRR